MTTPYIYYGETNFVFPSLIFKSPLQYGQTSLCSEFGAPQFGHVLYSVIGCGENASGCSLK